MPLAGRLFGAGQAVEIMPSSLDGVVELWMRVDYADTHHHSCPLRWAEYGPRSKRSHGRGPTAAFVWLLVCPFRGNSAV